MRSNNDTLYRNSDIAEQRRSHSKNMNCKADVFEGMRYKDFLEVLGYAYYIYGMLKGRFDLHSSKDGMSCQ